MGVNKIYQGKNMYECEECGTRYYTPEKEPPPSPNWADGHVCKMVLKPNPHEQNGKSSSMGSGERSGE